MKKSRAKLIIIIVILIAIGVFAYVKLIPEKDNILLKLFNSVTDTNKNQEANDSRNGVYVYKEILDKTYNITNSCHLSSLDKYIIVINKKYYVYNSTCMITYFEKEGEIDDLEFYIDNESKKYSIKYDDKDFIKDVYKKNFVNSKTEDIVDMTSHIDLDNLKFILKNTEIPNRYYNIHEAKISRASGKFRLELLYDESNIDLTISTTSSLKYHYVATDIDDLPKLYPVNTDYIAIIERDGKRSILKIINSDKKEVGIEYNSDDNFPKLVDNAHTLTNDNNIYIDYDSKNKKFDVLISLDGKFCVEDSTSNELTYYRYEITYDYRNAMWSKMNYKSAGYAQSSCSEVKEIMGDDYGIYN